MDVEALAGSVTANSSDTLFFFGDQADLEALLAALAERKQSPRVYLLSAWKVGASSRAATRSPAGTDRRLVPRPHRCSACAIRLSRLIMAN